MLNLECICLVKRAVKLGYPDVRGKWDADAQPHRCPYVVLVDGSPEMKHKFRCQCCPACTLLCLPFKVKLRKPEFADVFASLDLKLMEPK
jgi:hypothetical protein